MSSNIKEWESGLLIELGERVIQFGFDPTPRDQSFYRKFDGGKHALHVSFIKHTVDFDVTADVAVRFDALEELVNGFAPKLSKKIKDQTFSLGAELGNISGEGQCRWTIASKADVVTAASGISEKFKVVGIPYLERFSSLESVLEALSGDDKAAWLHSPIHGVRAKRAIAAAFLLNKKQAFLELVEKKTQFLKERNDFGLQDFLEMADDLREKMLQPTQR